MPHTINPVLAAAASNERPLREAATSGSVATSTSTTTRTSEVIDDPAAISFPTIMQDLKDAQQAGTELAAGVTKSLDSANDLRTTVASAAEDTATSNAIIALQQGNEQLEADANTTRVFQAAGGSADDLVILAQGRKQAQDRAIEAQLALQANIDTDFSEDFFGALGALFTREGFREEADVAKDTLALYDNSLGNVTALGSSADRAFESVKQTTTEATLEAQQNVAVQEALIKQTEYNIASKKSNAEALSVTRRFSKEDSDARLQQYKLGVQAKAVKEASADRKARFKRLEEEENFKQILATNVREGRRKAGIAVAPDNDQGAIDAEADEIFTSYKVGKESRSKVEAAYDLGSGVTSPTAFQTFKSVTRLSPASFTSDKSNKALQFLGNSSRTAATAIVQAGGDPNNEGVLNAPLNAQVSADFAAAEKTIVSGDDNNPNGALPLGTLVDLAYLPRLPAVQEVIKPLLVEGTNDMTPTELFDLMVSSVRHKGNKEGPILFGEAVDAIVGIYSVAVTENNESQNRRSFGLPEQTSYNSVLNSNSLRGLGAALGFGDLSTIDLTDRTEVTRSLARAIATKNFAPIVDLGLSKSVNNAEEK